MPVSSSTPLSLAPLVSRPNNRSLSVRQRRKSCGSFFLLRHLGGTRPQAEQGREGTKEGHYKTKSDLQPAKKGERGKRARFFPPSLGRRCSLRPLLWSGTTNTPQHSKTVVVKQRVSLLSLAAGPRSLVYYNCAVFLVAHRLTIPGNLLNSIG